MAVSHKHYITLGRSEDARTDCGLFRDAEMWGKKTPLASIFSSSRGRRNNEAEMFFS